jgi:hypothetical protein
MHEDKKPIDLKPFCADEDLRRPGLEKPMLIGDMVYATNGHLAVCCEPALTQDYLPTPGDAMLAARLLELFARSTNYLIGRGPVEWVRLDKIEGLGATITCPRCKGTKERQKCPECHGGGEVELKNEYHTYTCECQSCGGGGHDVDCEKCDGTGFVLAREYYDLGGVRMKAEPLVLLSALPDCAIAPTAAENPLAAIPVRFAGGVGIVMSMRKQEE